ncbi:MAG: sulfatase [Planctomycetales bacterium]|nr:sulfatase [Planctomycetales bacterium]
MNFRCSVALVALAGAYLLFGDARPTFAQAKSRPNILVVLCDDIRWNALSCMGHPHLKTPHIDRLAAEGLLFENSFCTTSLCSPSRASILSGLYAHAHGVTNNFTEYPDSMQTFPLRLHEAGYATAYVGKYHMGEDNDDPRPGFDHFVTHKGQGKYFDTEFNFNGQQRKVVEGYYTTVVTDMAKDWISQQSKEQPWMLMLGHKAPHSFYFPEPKYEHAFDDVEVNYPHSSFQLSDKPEWLQKRLTTWHGIYGPIFEWRKDFPDTSAAGVMDFQAMVRAYWGTILSVDDSMGALVSLLQSRGELDNTVILFMGDNGLLEGEHGMVDKRTMHEASIRIPIIIRYPTLAGGQAKRIAEQVLTVDIAPTLCELAGTPPLQGIHGRSMVGMINGTDADWRKSWFYHYNYEKQFPYTPNVRGIRTDRWKLIRYPHGDGQQDRHMMELYDLSNDPLESRNLSQDPDQQNRIKELSRELQQLMAATGIVKDEMPMDEGIKGELPDKAIR